MQDILTLAEAAEALRSSYATVTRHANSGALPTVRVFGRRYVCKSTIETMLSPPKERTEP